MPQLKNIRVREAKDRDIGLFKKLWLELLVDQEKAGSVVRADEQTLSFYETLFNAYLNHNLPGTVLFVADKAVLMWGDSGSPLSYPEKTVTAWGHYVVPESNPRIEEKLILTATEWAREQGFGGKLSQVSTDDEAAFLHVKYEMFDDAA